MKKFLTLSLLLLMSIACDAQVYDRKTVVDKFNDIISEKTIKTLIEKNDTAFVIEEKGDKPVQYRILSYDEEGAKGSKDNIVNIAGNLYGYEECWFAILEKDVPSYILLCQNINDEQDEGKKEIENKEITNKLEWLKDICPTVTYADDAMTSKKKLEEMIGRMNGGFTRYWP